MLITPPLPEPCHFTMKILSVFTAFLLLLLLLASSFLQAAMAGSAFCEGKCKQRCAKAGMMDRCLNYCGMCCEDCKCVPSGTYGNKDECPCYRDKVAKNNKNSKNNQNKPKCP